MQPEYVPACTMDAAWAISACAVDEEEWQSLGRTRELFNITGPDCLPRFSGTVRYETEIDLPEDAAGLSLDCSGAVRVFVDDEELGVRVAPPYHFAFPAGRQGKCRLRIEVTNAPVFRYRDALSFFVCIPPTGLRSQPVFLKRK